MTDRSALRYWQSTYASGQMVACLRVAKAVRAGSLLPARSRMCADCGEGAAVYDHRDYNRPLDVTPVCRRCNALRGPALWRAWASFDEFLEEHVRLAMPNHLSPTDIFAAAYCGEPQAA